jgi:hypothetical protein
VGLQRQTILYKRSEHPRYKTLIPQNTSKEKYNQHDYKKKLTTKIKKKMLKIMVGKMSGAVCRSWGYPELLERDCR